MVLGGGAAAEDAVDADGDGHGVLPGALEDVEAACLAMHLPRAARPTQGAAADPVPGQLGPPRGTTQIGQRGHRVHDSRVSWMASPSLRLSTGPACAEIYSLVPLQRPRSSPTSRPLHKAVDLCKERV
ncbi:hypothetical protein GCM10023145_26300 [Angustibacter luteus]